MKLLERYAVEATEPVIYIGHREYRRSDGSRYAGSKWCAEWCLEGRHYYHALRTTNKQAAIRKAHDVARRIHEGQGAPRIYRLSTSELCDRYLELVKNQMRKPGTITKYQHGLNEFKSWCRTKQRLSAARFSEQDFWAYNKWMEEDGKSEKTRYDRLNLVKQAFKFALRVKLIPENLLSGIKLVKPDPEEQPCFTPAQVAALLKQNLSRLHEIRYTKRQTADWRTAPRWRTWLNGIDQRRSEVLPEK